MYPSCLKNLIDCLKCLPGIGEKSAERLAFSIMNFDKEKITVFSNALLEVRDNIKRCKICDNITDKEYCSICSDERRRKDIVFVVEKPKDVVLFEKITAVRSTVVLFQFADIFRFTASVKHNSIFTEIFFVHIFACRCGKNAASCCPTDPCCPQGPCRVDPPARRRVLRLLPRCSADLRQAARLPCLRRRYRRYCRPLLPGDPRWPQAAPSGRCPRCLRCRGSRRCWP